jgi:hypothetical protein
METFDEARNFSHVVGSIFRCLSPELVYYIDTQ